jgi:hypothetical protein
MPIQLERLCDCLPHALGEKRRVRGLVHRRHDNGELVTPEARDRIGFAGAMAQSVGNHFQELVADGMAKRIIDALEVIEIEAKDGEAFAALHSLELVLDPLAQEHAIGQIGQGIMPRHVRDLRFRPLPFRDVLMGRKPSAVGHGLVGNRHDPAVGQLRRGNGSLSPCDLFQKIDDVFLGIARECARGGAALKKIANRHPRRYASWRQAVHFAVAPIAKDQASVRREHQHPLGHVVEDHPEQLLPAFRD